MDAMILAGGENRRFQGHKGLAEMQGKRIIEIISGILRKYFNKVWISTNSPEKFFYLGLPMVGDVISERGPLTGIFSVLLCAGVSEIFVAACDMPLISAELVGLIKKCYSGQDAVIPVYNGNPQPLPGIYSGNVRDVMEGRILSKGRAMRDLLNDINVYYIREEEISSIDPEGRSFTNINTREDLKQLTGG